LFLSTESGEYRLDAEIAQGKAVLAPELTAQGRLPVGHRQGLGSPRAGQTRCRGGVAAGLAGQLDCEQWLRLFYGRQRA